MSNSSTVPFPEAFSRYDWIPEFQPDATLRQSLTHNDVVPSIQFNTILALKSTIDRDKAFLQQDIGALQRQLEILQTRREQLNEISSAVSCPLSSIRLFPSEILLPILQDVCASDKTCKDILDASSSRWLLGRVCRKWRNIVNNCPALWTDILYQRRPRNARRDVFNARLNMVTEVLKRCGERKLSLTVSSTVSNMCLSWEAEERAYVLELLDARSERWERLDITLVDNVDCYQLLWLSSPRIHLPSLNTFHLTANLPHLLCRVHTFRKILTSMTSLHHLNLICVGLPSHPQILETVFCFPGIYPQLHSYRFATYNRCQEDLSGLSTHLLQVLQNSPNLVSFRYDDFNPIVTEKDGRRISHSLLQELQVATVQILDRFTFPALKSLVVGDVDNFYADVDALFVGSVNNMIQASQCLLTSLCLVGISFDYQALEIIRNMPSLENLKVGVHKWTALEDFFEDFVRWDSGMHFTFLPNLTHFELQIDADMGSKFDWVGPNLSEAVQHRSRAGLVSFRLHVEGNFVSWNLTEDQVDEMRRLDCVVGLILVSYTIVDDSDSCPLDTYDDHSRPNTPEDWRMVPEDPRLWSCEMVEKRYLRFSTRTDMGGMDEEEEEEILDQDID